MSVRRLADSSVQPAAFAFNGALADEAKVWIAKYPKGREQSAVIPLLMLAQDQEGWVTKAAIEAIADMLGMAYIRALEVATFYTQFQLKPVGTRAHVQVCGTTPCMLRGAEALMDVCRSKIHHDQFHPNAGGTLSWEEVECLGACVNAPMVMIFKDTYEDLTPARLGEIIDAFDAGRGDSVVPGPQNGRIYAVPASGLTTLRDETAVLKSTRDREKAASAEAPASGGVDGSAMPPSNAAKPKTDAAETNPAIKSPSPEKVSPAVEKAASAEAPTHSAADANMTAETVEKVAKQRTSRNQSSEPNEAFRSPEKGVTDPASPAAPAVGSQGLARDAVGLSVGPGTREASSAAKPSLDDKDRPAPIERPATVDDLKLISGVGPKIEGILHSLGIYTFAQVAAWSRPERIWVDGYLNFRGRIERDRWVAQAQALATGGVAEYVRVFGKDPR